MTTLPVLCRLPSPGRSSLAACLALALALGLPGCAPEDDEAEAASSTTTSALQATSQGGLTDGLLDTGGALAPDPEAAAAMVAERPARGLSPDGCATKTREGNVVTLDLDGCSGPFGGLTLRGALRATFTRASDDVLHVDIAGSDDLVANDEPMAYAARADVRYDGPRRLLLWHGSSRGTTKRGKAFRRETDLSIVADVEAKCADVDGVSKGTVGRFDVDATIEGLRVCRDACPTMGLARATVAGPAGALVGR